MSLSQKQRNNKIRRKGFLLLEVILSVLVIGTGVMLIMRSYSTSLRASDTARVMTGACLILEEKLFELDVKGFKDGVQEGEENGACEGQENYSWAVDIYAPDEKDAPRISKVDLGVNYKKGGQAKKVAVTTLLKYKEG